MLQSRGLRHWRVAESVHTFNGTKLVYSIAPGDFDRDGDTDLFVGANSGNTLLLNRHGSLHAVRPAKLGLPGHGSGASWVDYDNDGRLDLSSIPLGLYRQTPNGHFRRTGLLRNRLDSVWGINDWFDPNNDGYRDVVTAVRRPGGDADVDGRLWMNERKGKRWLEVDLHGRPATRRASAPASRSRPAGAAADRVRRRVRRRPLLPGPLPPLLRPQQDRQDRPRHRALVGRQAHRPAPRPLRPAPRDQPLSACRADRAGPTP